MDNLRQNCHQKYDAIEEFWNFPGKVKRTSQDRIYSELGLESLADRRYARRMIFFYKILNNQAPDYLRNYHLAWENTQHFLLHCSTYSHARRSLFDKLQTLDFAFYPLKPSTLCRLLLYGDGSFTSTLNKSILIFVIKYFHETTRFSGALF